MNLQKKEIRSDLGKTAAASLLLVGVTFALPFLLFCGTGERAGAAEEKPQTLPAVPSPVTAETVTEDTGTGEIDQARSVRVKCSDGTVVTTDMANYLWGVVAAEMPATFELEALKAQAVTARTYTLWKSLHNSSHADADICTDYTCCQAWVSKEDAAAKWGEHAAEYTDRITQAVTATDGKVLYYEGSPIQAVFHSSSAGSTEDAVNVWGSTVPYLVGVDTPEGDEVPNYHTETTLTADEVRAALEPLGCDLSGDPSTWFQAFTYTDSGAVAAAQVGGQSLTGTTLRSALGLRSASFEVTCQEGSFTFSVTGYGHGVGMSQYGANAMAQAGSTWREIVAWYYTGVTVGDYPEG